MLSLGNRRAADVFGTDPAFQAGGIDSPTTHPFLLGRSPGEGEYTNLRVQVDRHHSSTNFNLYEQLSRWKVSALIQHFKQADPIPLLLRCPNGRIHRDHGRVNLRKPPQPRRSSSRCGISAQTFPRPPAGTATRKNRAATSALRKRRSHTVRERVPTVSL